MVFNWTCPYCNRAQTVTEGRYSRKSDSVGVATAEGNIVLEQTAVGCSNPNCKKLTLQIRVGPDVGKERWVADPKKLLFSEQVLPRGSSKPQPEYIPAPLRDDYHEACLIRDLSPKASATLARRCLQGIIRDFAKISKATLLKEIEALKLAVENGSADRAISVETVEAIDHVRGLGNIGAHMEKDNDVIVPVDPDEAQHMIELIEMLFDEWYGARHRRTEKLAGIAKLGSSKQSELEAARQLKAVADSPGPASSASDGNGSTKSLEERLANPFREVSDKA
jgi:hypothetical protein